jgi:hypothetical protein
MERTTLRRAAASIRLLSVLAITASLVAPSVAQAQMAKPASPPKLSPQLDSVRTLLDKYQDPVAAVRDGYLSTLVCVDFPKGASEGTMQYGPGGMGVHFLNMGNVGPTLDPAKPQVLIYERDGDKLKLAAAEWFMPAAMVKEGTPPPSIFGQPLVGPMEGHAPIMPPEMHHYDLHVWLWKANPTGVFKSTNPAVSCPKTGYSYSGMPPKMVGEHTH